MGSGSCDMYDYDKMMNSGVIFIPNNCKLDYVFAYNQLNSLNFNVWINFEKYWNILYHKQFSSFEESITYNTNIGKYNFFITNHCPNEYISHLRSKTFFETHHPSIIHICSSRGAKACLDIMKQAKENDTNIYDILPQL